MRRDLIRTLRRLGEKTVPLSADGTLRLVSPSSDPCEVPAAAIGAMVREGLLKRVRGSVQRTEEGRAFLKRALASVDEDPFSAQHREMVSRDIGKGEKAQRTRVNAAESPLAWLATRKGRGGAPLLSKVQQEAGERLAADHERGHQRQSVTQSWDASGVRGSRRTDGLTVAEGALAAQRRVDHALAAVGQGLSDVLVAVCCEEIGLEAAEKRFGWPQRSGKLVLGLALDRLALHYGLAGAAEGGPGRLVHWGADGYRPEA